MKRTILICGLIAGLISVGWFVVGEQLITLKLSLNIRVFLGYATMLLGLSVIFVAVKNYRDNYNDGLINFGKAFRIGLLVTLVASTVYVIIWRIDFTWFIPDYFDKYQAQMLADLHAKGATAAEINAKTKDFNTQLQMYKNPIFFILFAYLEILPVGLVVSLIAALILKRKKTLEMAA